MKKSKVMKLILTIILGMVIAFTATQVLAADDDDLLEDFSPNNTNNSSLNTNNANNANNTNIANSNTNNTNSNTNLVSNNTNSSSYNNTNLPKTGIEDSMPVVVLVVIFGISAVYAYKKINDYKNV